MRSVYSCLWFVAAAIARIALFNILIYNELCSDSYVFYLCDTAFGKGKETKKAKNNIYTIETLFVIVNNWRQVQHKMLKNIWQAMTRKYNGMW